MPNYTNNSVAQLLRDNTQAYLWNNETVAAGTASIGVQLERVNRSFYPWGVSFEIFFTNTAGQPANPGTFEVDVQTADIDEDAHYCTINLLNSASQLNSSYVGRIELPSFWAKYVRAYLRTLTNAVNTSVLVTK